MLCYLRPLPKATLRPWADERPAIFTVRHLPTLSSRHEKPGIRAAVGYGALAICRRVSPNTRLLRPTLQASFERSCPRATDRLRCRAMGLTGWALSGGPASEFLPGEENSEDDTTARANH